MIQYDPSGMSLSSLRKLRGSVMPRGLCYAIPCSIAACLLSALEILEQDQSYGALATYVSFNSILGFLIVFRTQQAYSRYWEGLTLLQRVRGLWFNATSSLIAFNTADEKKEEQVQHFRLVLVRLVSLLHCAALRRVAYDGAPFDVIEVQGMSMEGLAMLRDGDPCLVIMQWIQQLIVNNIRMGVIDVAPPIVSRVFQELSLGIVNLADAEKISDTPFPFSSAQMIAGMMTCHLLISPVMSCLLARTPVAAAGAAFFAVFLLTCLNLMASEIEMPFGDDPNDLPLGEFQLCMNNNLRTLLFSSVNKVPEFHLTEESELCYLQSGRSIFTDDYQPEITRTSLKLGPLAMLHKESTTSTKYELMKAKRKRQRSLVSCPTVVMQGSIHAIKTEAVVLGSGPGSTEAPSSSTRARTHTAASSSVDGAKSARSSAFFSGSGRVDAFKEEVHNEKLLPELAHQAKTGETSFNALPRAGPATVALHAGNSSSEPVPQESSLPQLQYTRPHAGRIREPSILEQQPHQRGDDVAVLPCR